MKDSVARAIEKFKTYPSILIIKDKIFQGNNFSFTEDSQSEIEKEIKTVNVKKVTKKNIKNIKNVETLQQLFNQALTTEEFPSNLKKMQLLHLFDKTQSIK